MWTKLCDLFKWIYRECKDWRTLVLFIIVFLIMSSEVWLLYILGAIFNNAWLIGVASACWLFWLGPFTPFLPLCIAITFGIKKLFNHRKKKKDKEID